MSIEESNHRANSDIGKSPIIDLLDRPETEEMLRINSELVQEIDKVRTKKGNRGLYFRLGNRWFAFQTNCVAQVCEIRKVHSLPHISSKAVIGVLNIQGQVQLCVSLKMILEIADSGDSFVFDNNEIVIPRMIVFDHEGHVWVFPADEVDGVYTWEQSDIENIPSTIEHTEHNFFKGMVRWEHECVYLINEQVLFQYLLKYIY